MILVVALGASGFAITAYAFHLFGFGIPSCGCGSTLRNSSPGAHFTVVMSLNGFNDSRIHGLPWPIMNVTLGQSVTIHLVNCDTTQAHGFFISHYMRSGVTVAPGQCLDLPIFTADTAGTFPVYCTIICTVHVPWMFDGKFNVNP